jgi:hypothetical protein
MRRIKVLLVILLVAAIVFAWSGVARAVKLKVPGKVLVTYEAGAVPDGQFHTAQWVTGLSFTNSTDTAAVVVYRPKQDPTIKGLHLNREAAVILADDLQREAGSRTTGSVQVWNHSGGLPNRWKSFAPDAARALAVRIRDAASLA